MSSRQPATVTQPSTGSASTGSDSIDEQAHEEGLTDDERVSREEQSRGQGARVNPGPADLERLSKP